MTLANELMEAMLSKDDEKAVDILREAMVEIDGTTETTSEGSTE